MAIVRGNTGSITLPSGIADTVDVLIHTWTANLEFEWLDASTFSNVTDGAPSLLNVGQRIKGTAEGFIVAGGELLMPAVGSSTAAEFILRIDDRGASPPPVAYEITFNGELTTMAINGVTKISGDNIPRITLSFEDSGSVIAIT